MINSIVNNKFTFKINFYNKLSKLIRKTNNKFLKIVLWQNVQKISDKY